MAATAVKDAPVKDASADILKDGRKDRRRKHVPGFELDCGTGSEVPHVGIAFVHGIGSQAPGETLLDWGGAIIGLLLDARVEQQTSGDPVIACELDPGPGKSRYVELQLPAATARDGRTVKEQHWVMTEAWWAQRVRAPAFGQMADWLGPRGAISRILLALLPRPRDEHDPRLRPSAQEHGLRRDTVKDRVEEAADKGGVAGRKDPGPWHTALREVTRVSGGLYLQAISALILVVYGALRSIEKLLPIGPLKNGALTRPIDEFMLDWFGDVYVLLSDPAQAASVRGQLVDAIRDLQAANCETIVVVAHSGGAIVSYMTIADPANRKLPVDSLITIGEGINLAWRLTPGTGKRVDPETRRRYQRLFSDLFAERPDLEWHDFWASQDPAPVGVPAIPDTEVIADEELSRVRSHAIWNRLAFAEDHGTYWENDEEFVLPLVRLIDGGRGGTAFFGTTEDDKRRSKRRRRRLSVLSICRQLALIAPTSAIVIAFAQHSDFIWRAADAVAFVWSKVPGSAIVSDPLNELRDLGIQGSPVGGFVSQVGLWIIAVLIGLVAIFALIAPSERSVPWADGRRNLLSTFIRLVPWLIGVPVIIAVIVGGVRLVEESTIEAQQAGIIVVATVAELLTLALFIEVVFGSRGSPPDPKRRLATLLDLIEMFFTMVVMTAAAFFALTPFVSAVAFVDVGRAVLGSLTVLAAFQVIGRVGMWRWRVWDGRERLAARVNKDYPRLRRVVIQLALLLATLVILFAAVVTNDERLAGVAAIGVAASILLGVSVDVFNAARQERTTPTTVALDSGHYKM